MAYGTLKFRQAVAFQNLSFKKAVYSLGGQKAHKVKKRTKSTVENTEISMKNHALPIFLAFFAIFLLGPQAWGQYDDIYFDGEEEPTAQQQSYQEPPSNYDQNSYDRPEQEYVDARYDNAYAARIRRFHRPARGFNYYSNYYVDNYWYNPYQPGINIYCYNRYRPRRWRRWGYSYGWGYNNPYDPWYTPYNNWGYNPYNNWAWGYNPYRRAYNQGYWNGFHHGAGNNWYYESSAPNAANYVTTRYSRGSDPNIQRSRSRAVNGYDTHQRQAAPASLHTSGVMTPNRVRRSDLGSGNNGGSHSQTDRQTQTTTPNTTRSRRSDLGSGNNNRSNSTRNNGRVKNRNRSNNRSYNNSSRSSSRSSGRSNSRSNSSSRSSSKSSRKSRGR